MSIYTSSTTVVKRHAGGNARNKRCTHPRKIERQEGAKARAAEYAKLTTQQKIDRLDVAFGKGVGAAKERAKLAKLLTKKS